MSGKKEFLQGVKAGLPVLFGFIPVGIAFAVSSAQSGLTAAQTILMSVFVFAGASQMMAVDMLGAGAGAFTVVLATSILNLRHLIMSTCVMNRLKAVPVPAKIALAFGVTDESFAIFTTGEHAPSPFFYGGLVIITYAAWVAGTAVGALFYSLLPPLVSDSLGIALYALFIGLLAPSVKKNLRLGLVVLLTALLNIILGRFLPPSWAVIVSTLLGALLGTFLTEEKEAAAS